MLESNFRDMIFLPLFNIFPVTIIVQYFPQKVTDLEHLENEPAKLVKCRELVSNRA